MLIFRERSVHVIGTVIFYRQRLRVRRASTKYMGADQGFYKPCALFKLVPVVVASVTSGPCGLPFKEESQNFSGGVWAVRIGVSAVCAAAGPGMATPVDEPLLNDHRAGLVTLDRAGMRTYRGVSCFRTLDALTR